MYNSDFGISGQKTLSEKQEEMGQDLIVIIKSPISRLFYRVVTPLLKGNNI